MLRDLYLKLIESLYQNEVEIEKTEQVLLISIPWDETPRSNRERDRDDSISFPVNFKVIPRIGEEIRLPFIDGNIRYNHGYVHNVTHEIYGSVQKILIEAHPFNDYYHKWEKMKKQKEVRDGWRRSSQAVNVPSLKKRAKPFMKINSGLS